jgi:hypothetical protein
MVKLKLFAEPECWEFKSSHPDEWDTFACGPGDLGDYLVPDSILGVSVTESCRIHDWYYRFYPGGTENDRAMADRVLLNNMLRTIVANSSYRWVIRARCWMAHVYFKSVRKYGAPAFFEERNENAKYKEV